tara:strand:+ start:14585 stop:15115 length:531 start_codon:yes stop_codon:yes gene_type:complete
MQNIHLINNILSKDNKAQKLIFLSLKKQTMSCSLNIELSKLESNFYGKLLKSYTFIEMISGQKPVILKVSIKKQQKSQNILFNIGVSVRNFLRVKYLSMYYLNILIPLAKSYNQLLTKLNLNNIGLTIQNINLFIGLDETLYILNKQKIKLNFNYSFITNFYNSINLKNYATLLLQ